MAQTQHEDQPRMPDGLEVGHEYHGDVSSLINGFVVSG